MRCHRRSDREHQLTSHRPGVGSLRPNWGTTRANAFAAVSTCGVTAHLPLASPTSTPLALDWPPRRRPGHAVMCLSSHTQEARASSCYLTGTGRFVARLPSDAVVSIPPADDARQSRAVDPADLPGQRAARRRFWGVTPSCHRRAAEVKGAFGQTPLTCLAPPDADAQTRTTPVSPREAKVNASGCHEEKREKTSALRERTLTFEAINRFGGVSLPGA